MSGPMSPERLDEIREALKGTARRADVADWDLTVYRAVKQRLLEAVNLLDEVERLRAELAARPTRAEVLSEALDIAELYAENSFGFGNHDEGHGAQGVANAIRIRLRRVTAAAEQGETGGAR